jgi:hypothetical protein
MLNANREETQQFVLCKSLLLLAVIVIAGLVLTPTVPAVPPSTPRSTSAFPLADPPPLVGRVCLVSGDSGACPQTLPRMVADSTGHLNVSVSILGSTVFNGFSISVQWNPLLMNATGVAVTSAFLPHPIITTECVNGSGSSCVSGDGPGTVHVGVVDINDSTTAPTSGQLFRISFGGAPGTVLPVGFATGCEIDSIGPGLVGPGSFPGSNECVMVAEVTAGVPTTTVIPIPEGLQSQSLGTRLPSRLSSLNGTIASTLNSGGAPNYADTWVLPYAITLPGNLTGWKAQFSGANTPVGLQIKILRRVSPSNLTVVEAGPIHNPAPVLFSRLPGYPIGFTTEETVIPIYTDSLLTVKPGDLIGLTIKADPALGSYDYAMVNTTGTHYVTRNVPLNGTIDLLDPGTGTFFQAPALELTIQPSPPKLDTAGDGIPDFVALSPEMQSLGVDPCRKTVLVQLDYMTGLGFTHKPLQAALDMVTQAFDAATVPAASSCPYSGFPKKSSGINLIFDVKNAIPFQADLNFTNSFPLSFDSVKATYFDSNRAPYFHYGLFTHNLALGSTISGVAETYGSNFIVSLGGWTNNVGSISEQAGTLMHELGHNLGLHHGGSNEINFKPNYISVMNYAYQVVGIVTRTPTGNVTRFDYSREPLATLNESNLNEWQRTSSANDYAEWVCPDHHTVKMDVLSNLPDWNCDGQLETGVAVDLNNDTIIGPLAGFNDWANLRFNFTHSPNYNLGCVTGCDIGCVTGCDIGCVTGCDIGCKLGCDFGLELNYPTAKVIEARWNAFFTSTHDSTSASLNCTPGSFTVTTPTSCTVTITDTGVTPIGPTGNVSFLSSQPGSFTPSTCVLAGTGASTSCSVAYTPNVFSTGSQQISAGYTGDGSHFGSDASITVNGLPLTAISVSKFFTDSNLNPLPTDNLGNPEVGVIISRGTVTSTNPGQILAWTNVTNTGSNSMDSVRLNETLPVDWDAHPSWLPAKGAIHVYLVYSNGTSIEITDPNTITIGNTNPEILTINIPDLGATTARTSLTPGERILVSVKLVYSLIGTFQPGTTYPRVYSDKANVTAWVASSYAGDQATGQGSATLTAYAQVVGDVNGDGKVGIDDLALVASSFGSKPGYWNYNPAADLNHDGRIDIFDLTIVAIAFGT